MTMAAGADLAGQELLSMALTGTFLLIAIRLFPTHEVYVIEFFFCYLNSIFVSTFTLRAKKPRSQAQDIA